MSRSEYVGNFKIGLFLIRQTTGVIRKWLDFVFRESEKEEETKLSYICLILPQSHMGILANFCLWIVK